MTRKHSAKTPESLAKPASSARRQETGGARERRQLAGNGRDFPIVGIGASAGGLGAFTEVLKHLPLHSGMGFVLVQHLSPGDKRSEEHTSELQSPSNLVCRLLL